jgi:hypothetical protein
VVAARFNPTLKAFRDRFVLENGKPKMVMLAAVARKG